MSTGHIVQSEVIDRLYGGIITDQNGEDTGSRLLLTLHADEAAAHAECDALTAKASRLYNPFHLDLTGGQTPPIEKFVADLPACGVRFQALPRPNEYGSYSDHELADWWDREVPHLTEAERVTVWKLLPRPLYTVAAVEVA